MWPQLTYVTIAAFGVVGSLYGAKTKAQALGTLFAVGVSQWLLYMGGFYNVFLR